MISDKEKFHRLKEQNPRAEVVLVEIEVKKREDMNGISEEDLEWAKAECCAQRIIKISDGIDASRILRYSICGKSIPKSENQKIEKYYKSQKNRMVYGVDHRCILIGDRSLLPADVENKSFIFVKYGYKLQSVESIAIIYKKDLESNLISEFIDSYSKFHVKTIILFDRETSEEDEIEAFAKKYKIWKCIEIPKGTDAGRILRNKLKQEEGDPNKCSIA